jgi:hypothetical protein
LITDLPNELGIDPPRQTQQVLLLQLDRKQTIRNVLEGDRSKPSAQRPRALGEALKTSL